MVKFRELLTESDKKITVSIYIFGEDRGIRSGDKTSFDLIGVDEKMEEVLCKYKNLEFSISKRQSSGTFETKAKTGEKMKAELTRAQWNSILKYYEKEVLK